MRGRRHSSGCDGCGQSLRSRGDAEEQQGLRQVAARRRRRRERTCRWVTSSIDRFHRPSAVYGHYVFWPSRELPGHGRTQLLGRSRRLTSGLCSAGRREQEVELSDVIVSGVSADDGDKQPLMVGKARSTASAAAKVKSTASPAAADSPRSLPAARAASEQSDQQMDTVPECSDQQHSSGQLQHEDDERPWYRHRSVLIALFTSACGAFLFSGIDEVRACCLWHDMSIRPRHMMVMLLPLCHVVRSGSGS